MVLHEKKLSYKLDKREFYNDTDKSKIGLMKFYHCRFNIFVQFEQIIVYSIMIFRLYNASIAV